jgi:dihydroorotate dehydrogenase electron transfer subunit
MKVEQKCKIISKSQLGDAIYMTLAVGDMVRTSFRAPGQFVHIKCGDALLLRRPISVCSCQTDDPDDLLTIVFEVRGEGTRWLANRPVGHTLDVMGLAGNGFSIRPEGRYLLVGGGIGIPPMLGCAQYTQGKSTAILAGKTRKKIILLDEFGQNCTQTLVATDDGSLGYCGFVDYLVRGVLNVHKKQDKFDAVLACGPKPMLRMTAEVAREFGVPCQVSMEERMGCGVGACLVCACDMTDGSRKHVCKDGPVFNAQEVDWNV